MASYSTDRRGALKIISAIGASCAYPYASDELYGQTVERQVQASYFNEADFKVISRIADLIIPKTDTPGAIEAGVPIYIDTVISKNKAHQALAAEGLRWLAQKNFIDLKDAEELAILQPLCDAADAGDLKQRPVQFFQLIKNLTADGYYTSQIGLISELGYSGNTMMSEFPTCEHEH